MQKNAMAWSYRKNARHRNPKKKMYGKLQATRRRGRPKKRWLYDVSTDLRKIGVNEWRDRARNREAWRHIVEEAKAHPRAVAPLGVEWRILKLYVNEVSSILGHFIIHSPAYST
jgi:hypothetical protein